MANVKTRLLELKTKLFKKNVEEPRTALDRMNAVLNFINTIAYMPGIEFVDDWKPNKRQVFAAVVNFSKLSSIIYTLLIAFPSRDNVLLAGAFAFNVIVWTKLIFISRNHDNFMSLIQFIVNVFKGNRSGMPEQILSETTAMINYHTAINIGSFCAGLSFFLVVPGYEYFVHGNLMLVSPMLVPFVDSTQIKGYIITTFYNLFAVSVCICICVAVSSLFFALVDSYDGLVSLIEYDFGVFDDLCEENTETSHVELFRNIIMKLMDLTRFSCYMNDLFNVISTVQVTMSLLVVVLAILGYLAFDLINLVGAALIFYAEMQMYCYIGQLLDNTNVRIAVVICNTKHYYYTVECGRDLMVALYIAQKMQPIRILNVLPLNFETGLNENTAPGEEPKEKQKNYDKISSTDLIARTRAITLHVPNTKRKKAR